MANLLSGISSAAHQGLANMVTSKRAERQMAREQRRYENELLFRLNSAASAKREREKVFAYQKTRDEIGDQQWAEAMGLRTDQFEETKRSNRAREEDVDLARQLQADQFEKTHAENIRQHTEDISLRREGMAQSDRHFREGMTQRKQEHLDTLKEGSLARQLTQNRDQATAEHYREIIRLREQELNRPLTDLEKRKIEAEIAETQARTRYYDRRPTQEGSGTGLYEPTATERSNVALNTAKRITQKSYVDSKEKGFWRGLNPWDDAPWSSTDPNTHTLPDILSQLGADAYRDIIEGIPVSATSEGITQAKFYLGQVFDMLVDEGSEVWNHAIFEEIRDQAPGAVLSDKLNAARREFIEEGIKRYMQETSIDNKFRQQTTTPTGERTVGDLDVPGVSRQHDFRNRGVR